MTHTPEKVRAMVALLTSRAGLSYQDQEEAGAMLLALQEELDSFRQERSYVVGWLHGFEDGQVEGQAKVERVLEALTYTDSNGRRFPNFNGDMDVAPKVEAALADPEGACAPCGGDAPEGREKE